MDYHKYFGLDTRSVCVGFDEMARAVNAEERHILAHAKYWDLKWDENKNPYLSYRFGNYDIDLPKGRKEIGEWAYHISKKTWMHPEAIYEFIHVACAAKHCQELEVSQ